MTEKDVLTYEKSGIIDKSSADEFRLATHSGIYGLKASLESALLVMQECVDRHKKFRCAYVTGESCNEENSHKPYIDCWAE